eukprot:7476878-Lingulodinium_polyedra.AAC.1
MVAPQARTAVTTSSGLVHQLGTAVGLEPEAALRPPLPAARLAAGAAPARGALQEPGRARIWGAPPPHLGAGLRGVHRRKGGRRGRRVKDNR